MGSAAGTDPVDQFDEPAEDQAESPADGPAQPEPPAGLDELSLRILAFERRWWRNAGAKDQAVRDAFGLSPTRYYQLLNALLDEPAAMAADPVTVRRLLRLRARRTVR
mgnify:CR=1 FL=1